MQCLASTASPQKQKQQLLQQSETQALWAPGILASSPLMPQEKKGRKIVSVMYSEVWSGLSLQRQGG